MTARPTQHWLTHLTERQARQIRSAAAYGGLTIKAYMTSILEKHLELMTQGAGPLATVLRNAPEQTARKASHD